MVATTLGKQAALDALAARRAENKTLTLPRNEDLPAGSAMVFRCLGCGAPIWVDEGYITRPKMCSECQAMHDLGWLE